MKETTKSFSKPILFAYILSFLAFLGAIFQCIYCLLFCKESINQMFLIISSILIFIFTGVLATSIFLRKKKIHYILLSISSLFIFAFILFNLLSITNIIKLPTLDTLKSFYNTNINDALVWGQKNNIVINQTYEYSDTISEYNIITQDVAPGTLLKDVKQINFLVSSGPNPYQTFILQSLIGLKIDDAIAILNNNFMKNVIIDYELNDTYEKDTIISQSISGEVKRNDALTLTVSLGTEEALVPVELINFSGKTLFDAELWLKRNGFKYEINYEFSDSYNKDICISQNEKAGTTVDPKETIITLIVSKGKEILIPDFTTMTISEATKWISDNKLKVVFKEAYDNELESGTIISSSFAINTAAEEGDTIELIVSKGKLKMESFDNINSFRAWAEGLGLAYEENSTFSDLDIGSIVSITPNVGENINLNEKIYVTYSKGKATTIPNFYNKSKSEADSLCYNYSLKCYYSYRYSDSIASGYIISQSMSKNSEVAQNTSITLYISSGPEPKKEEPVNTCTSTEKHNLNIQANWTTGGSASTTISTLKTKLSALYPKITFNFTTKPGYNPSGWIHEDSPITSGSVVQDCQTYTIIINE